MAAIADVAVGGEQAFGVLQVLHTQRQAVQWRQGVAAHDGGLSHARRRSRAIEVGRADGVDKRVERFDACNARVHQLHRRELARADAAAQFAGSLSINRFDFNVGEGWNDTSWVAETVAVDIKLDLKK